VTVEDRVLAVDVGGTTIKAGWFTADGTVLDEWRVPTPQDDTGLAVVDVVARFAAAAPEGSRVRAIGLVVPGIVDDRAGIVIDAVNLGWKNLPMRHLLRDSLRHARIDAEVAFGQDVRAGALAESLARPAHDGELVAFVPVGTGIAAAYTRAGCLVLDHPLSGEIGQVPIAPGVKLEDVASAAAIARRLGVPDAAGATALVRAGDARALEVWNDAVEALGLAVSWLRAALGVDAVILGGGLAMAGSLLFDPLTAAVATHCGELGAPALLHPRHDDASALVGAATLASRAAGRGRR